ncbi:60S ribosomal protein L12 [Tupaia chinensis]|uniref:60S ribosomal protein L12 n=1 Tax=Tupaia chinensis TaxID=246437 RepID=L9JB89_TUPCH|nr:60S ribosomal protein L12 [Tupaia chinensis]
MIMKLLTQNRQAQIEVVPSASAMIITALRKLLRDRKKQKNSKHSGNITSNKIVNITQQVKYQFGAREFSGTTKEILGTTAQTVAGRHPHDSIDDSSGAVGYLAS